jgi:hypothetical protein
MPFEFLDAHSEVLYPVLAVGVLVLVFLGVVMALKNNDLDLSTRIKFKREIIRELRLRIAGVSTDDLADMLKTPPQKLEPLLSEMAKDGSIAARMRKKQQLWVVKGIS